MSIYIDENKGIFHLMTRNTEYQMMADKYGVLRHLWYGKRTETDMSYLIDYPDVGFSGNPYCVGNDRTYSLDMLPLEYACEGIGDYRINAISVSHKDGSNALDLRYKSYRIYKGKYSITGLPAVYADMDSAETLEIILRDTASGLETVLRYGVLERLDIITRSTVIRNCDNKAFIINKAASLCLDIPYGAWEWIHFHGRHNMERLSERRALFHGVQESSSTRGTSSHQQNPSVILCSPDCTEDNGECVGAFFVYSGSFSIRIELDQLNQTRLIMGMNPELFKWHLQPGEEFETPEAVITYSDKGLGMLSHNFHNVIRKNICRRKGQLLERPVLINNWEATYFDFSEEKLLRIAEQAAELGVNMFVLDDGWFGKRDDDLSGLGDWFVNEKKIKGGLGRLAEKIKALGMRFGIWIEPEMVSEDSELYRKHPEWAIRIPSREPVRGRYQLLLDMSRSDVQEYLYSAICSILKNADISYIKWDMNRSISDWYSSLLSAKMQCELPHRYMLGLYALLERITSEFPDVLFEGCSGGGGRFDAGMLYYCPQIWCSDDTDAYERTKIQYGTSFIYPVSTIGSHVSAVPNHQTGRVIPIETRAVTAMAGSFGYELDPAKLYDEEKAAIAIQIKKFRKYSALIHRGKYYRLSDPFKDNYAIWSFVSSDRSEVLVHGVVFFAVPNMKKSVIKLKGLDPCGYYKLEMEDKEYSGAALMNGGIFMPKACGDYIPVEIYLKRKES